MALYNGNCDFTFGRLQEHGPANLFTVYTDTFAIFFPSSMSNNTTLPGPL